MTNDSLAVVACACLVMAVPSPRVRAQEPEGVKPAPEQAAAAKESAERLVKLRRRAEGTHVFIVDDDGREEVEMRSEPVFRYADQPRSIVDGTLWVWGGLGRPAALQKVEYFIIRRFLRTGPIAWHRSRPGWWLLNGEGAVAGLRPGRASSCALATRRPNRRRTRGPVSGS